MKPTNRLARRWCGLHKWYYRAHACPVCRPDIAYKEPDERPAAPVTRPRKAPTPNSD